MLFRFSLYGFLKNQRYFEPFLVLLLLDKGLTYFLIGILIAILELVVNVLEIPSGVIADVLGRRGAMIASFAAYIVSFLLFARAEHFAAFVFAMVLFAFGDAFRTGTHKAIIFAWLRSQGRENERTQIYGYTRSWSKIGSALSALIAAGLVLSTGSYALVFYLATIPYVICIGSFLTYPKDVDVDKNVQEGPSDMGARLRDTLRQSLHQAFSPGPLRRLIAESMGFEGVFAAVKDDIQPVVVAAALVWLGHFSAQVPSILQLNAAQKSAVLLGPVYFVLFLVAAFSSRQAHRVLRKAGSEARAAHWVWIAYAVAFASMGAGTSIESAPVVIGAFVLLYALQNIWRPILVSRFDALGNAATGATLLSVESQARRLATMVLAPALGWAVDHAAGDVGRFWPVAAVGGAFAVVGALASHRQGQLAS